MMHSMAQMLHADLVSMGVKNAWSVVGIEFGEAILLDFER